MRIFRFALGFSVPLMAGCLNPQSASVKAETRGTPVANKSHASADLDGKIDLMIFLLIGQSNMVGAPKPEAVDEVEILTATAAMKP